MKVLSFLKKSLITLICLFIALIIGCFFFVHSYSRFDQDAQAACLSSYSPVSQNIYTDVTPNNEVISAFTSFINSLSPNVSEAFLKDWKIIISPNIPQGLNLSMESQSNEIALEDVTAPNSILGYSDWHLRLIYLRAQPDPTTTLHVFTHELGHCFDYEFGTPSSTDQFKQIFSLYKDTFIEQSDPNITNHVDNSPEEFFATVFKEYFLSPEHLKTNAPEAYEFFDEIYAQVSADLTADSTVKYDLHSSFLILKKKFTK